MESAGNAGFRSAISKTEIRKIPDAIKALQRGETFFYSKESSRARPAGIE